MASQGCFEMLLGVARGDGYGDTDRLLLSTICCLCVYVVASVAVPRVEMLEACASMLPLVVQAGMY